MGTFCLLYPYPLCRTVVARKKLIRPIKGLPAWGSTFPEDVSTWIVYDIPYSTKLWREKTLADLAVHCQSAKVLSAKMLWDLMSSNSEWAFPLPTAKIFPANLLAVPIPPKFSPAKVLCYTVPILLFTLLIFHKLAVWWKFTILFSQSWQNGFRNSYKTLEL